MLITSSNKSLINKLKILLSNEFEMKELDADKKILAMNEFTGMSSRKSILITKEIC